MAIALLAIGLILSLARGNPKTYLICPVGTKPVPP